MPFLFLDDDAASTIHTWVREGKVHSGLFFKVGELNLVYEVEEDLQCRHLAHVCPAFFYIYPRLPPFQLPSIIIFTHLFLLLLLIYQSEVCHFRDRILRTAQLGDEEGVAKEKRS